MALITCPECSSEISDRAASCPKCGAPIASATEATKKGGYIPYTDQEVAVMLTRKKKTSHLLHLVLSLCTVGLWVVIWVLVAVSNSIDGAGIDRKIAKGKWSKQRK